MTGGGWAWVLSWMTAAIGIPCALAWATQRHRHRRVAAAVRAARQAQDAKFAAAHGIDWNATAPERTP